MATRRWAKVQDTAKTDAAGFKVGRTDSNKEVLIDGTTVWVASEDLSPDDDFLD